MPKVVLVASAALLEFYEKGLNEKDFEAASNENGKIVEHGDVVQPIPEKAANLNGMF